MLHLPAHLTDTSPKASSTPYQYITEGLPSPSQYISEGLPSPYRYITEVLFTHQAIFTLQQKITRQLKEMKQTSEWEPDMAKMLELSDQGF